MNKYFYRSLMYSAYMWAEVKTQKCQTQKIYDILGGNRV